MNPSSTTEIKFGFLRAEWDHFYYLRRYNPDHFSYTGETLTHFTDLNGFLGIVESAAFWLSDHRFLNDKQEFEDGRNLAIALIRKMAAKDRYQEFCAILREVALRLENHEEGPYYICSFSKVSDSLEQWRAYGQNGQGLSMVFRNQDQGQSPFCMLPHLISPMVVYHDAQKVKILLSIIRKYAIEFRQDLAYGNRVNEEDWAEKMTSWLSMRFINFKNKAYASEQEVRLLASSAHANTFGGVKHRAGKYGIIPYVSTAKLYTDHSKSANASFRLPIQEIWVGPAANQSELIRSIEVFLRNKGYKDVLVKKSTVPYRG